MATPDAFARFQSAEAIRKWVRQCGFPNNREAAAALFIADRTFYRLKSEGLPLGGRGRLLAARMALVLDARSSSTLTNP